MPLKFPLDCDSPRRRTEYCYRAIELLRLIHNGMGRWYREGLTQNQWNRFPQKLKNRYSYKTQLTEAEWYGFINLFDRFEGRVMAALLVNRELLANSTNWSINEDDLVTED